MHKGWENRNRNQPESNSFQQQVAVGGSREGRGRWGVAGQWAVGLNGGLCQRVPQKWLVFKWHPKLRQ